MTKSEFITLWARIKPIITKPVNGHPAIDCDCEFIDHCGGYQLNVRPQCILWPYELIFLLSAVESLHCCAACRFYDGSIYIY